MADFTKRIISIVLYLVSGIQLVSCSLPYCEWNLCSPDNEICCADGVCCSKQNISPETFYIVACVLSALLVLAILGTGLFHMNKRIRFCTVFRRDSQRRELLEQNNSQHI